MQVVRYKWATRKARETNAAVHVEADESCCIFADQFECWKNGQVRIEEPARYQEITELVTRIFQASMHEDPTEGTDHFHNPDKERRPSWIDNCHLVRRIGNHVFYRSKSL